MLKVNLLFSLNISDAMQRKKLKSLNKLVSNNFKQFEISLISLLFARLKETSKVDKFKNIGTTKQLMAMQNKQMFYFIVI